MKHSLLTGTVEDQFLVPTMLQTLIMEYCSLLKSSEEPHFGLELIKIRC
jgi:hypothetical protein